MENALHTRQKSHEHNFILQTEQDFKARVSASKLFALWAAKEMNYTEDQITIYSKNLIELSIHNKEYLPIIEHVYKDLSNFGINISKNKLEFIYLEKLDECRAKILNS